MHAAWQACRTIRIHKAITESCREQMPASAPLSRFLSSVVVSDTMALLASVLLPEELHLNATGSVDAYCRCRNIVTQVSWNMHGAG